MSKKIKEKKKKAKERVTHQKKVQDRLFAARRARYEREIELEAKRNSRVEPIRNKTHLEKIQEHLDRNMEVLQALEQEYMEAQKSREGLHEELEAEGYASLEEKMEALKQKAMSLASSVQESQLLNESTQAEGDQHLEESKNKVVSKKRFQKLK